MIDRSHDLPITRQAKMLNVSRGSVYYRPRAPSSADLALMRRMDELHLDYPFAGSRMLRDLMTAEGFQVGRRHVATADEANGNRSRLPQAQHFETGAGAQDLSVSAAQSAGHAPQSGLGHGSDLRSHGARLRLPGVTARK